MAEEKIKEEVIQLVICKLADEEYGIPVHQVQEIVPVPVVTRIPGMPLFIEGVINLRGKIIPLVDLRRRFGFEARKKTENVRIVVAQIGEQTIGVVVDSVSEVLRLKQTAIEPLPHSMHLAGADFLTGVGKLENRIVILLDLEKMPPAS